MGRRRGLRGSPPRHRATVDSSSGRHRRGRILTFVPANLRVSISSLVPLGDLVARVDMADGSSALLLVNEGRFDGALPSKPVRLRLTTQEPEGEVLLSQPAAEAAKEEREPAGERVRVDMGVLSREGVAVPEDGRVSLELLWLAACDGAPEEKGVEGTRFGSYEHTTCARLVGKGPDRQTPLNLRGIIASFNEDTELPVGDKRLIFGEIIALAGDFYAYLDKDALESFSWAWPAPPKGVKGWLLDDYRLTTLAGDEVDNVDTLRKHIFAEAHGGSFFDAVAKFMDTAIGGYPMRRYLALASQNPCHFACQPRGYGEDHNEALRLYRAYHRRALGEAMAAGQRDDRDSLLVALATDAFGCHFFTDLFASGHIRVPRRVLGDRFGIARGALMMSKKMHDEDNELGLWCTTLARQPGARREVWRAYGDGALGLPESKPHLERIQEAVRVSAAEVFAAFVGGMCNEPPIDVGIAEALVPVPLPPGHAPDDEDILPEGHTTQSFPPNHYPLYTLLDDGRVAERAGDPDCGEYNALEVATPSPVLA